MNHPVYYLKNVRKVLEKNGVIFELIVPELFLFPGEFVVMVGESGCGKSTLLDILGLVLSPTLADEFIINDPQNDKIYRILELGDRKLSEIRKFLIGYVLQSGGLLPFLSVRENILLGLRLKGLQEKTSSFQYLVHQLEITEQLDKKPQHLSGGQRQRVAIAQALSKGPTIVLADEPTAAVDRKKAFQIRDIFKSLTHKMGITLVLVTHDKSLVKGIADRMFQFNVEEIKQNHAASIITELKSKW